MYKYSIVVIAYNRDKALKNLLARLDECEYYGDTLDLCIRIDKSNNPYVKEVADSFVWKYGNKRVICADTNIGLKNNILSAGDLLNEYDAIVVFEDDIFPSKYFYNYMRQAVPFYFDCDNIAGISLYSYSVNQRVKRSFTPIDSCFDTFFIQHAISWGQIWISKQWFEFKTWLLKAEKEKFESPVIPDDIISWGDRSWLKWHIKYCIENDKYFVMPYISLTTNNHLRGEHSVGNENIYQVPLCECERLYNFAPLNELSLCYDVYFENLGLENYFQKELGSKVTIDLYGGKKYYDRYILTSKKLPYKSLKQFGLSFRPIESNILHCVDGEFFNLYDIEYSSEDAKESQDIISEFKYDTQGFVSKKLLIHLLVNEIKESIKNKFRGR